MTTGGDWLLLQEWMERGDPGFVDRLRSVTDADALGQFAERWYANPSSNARRLLFEYLERPLNAYRHEALVKRLFKRAEAAGDDGVMARFLVAFDRSIRRVERKRIRRERVLVASREEADQLAARSQALGYEGAWVAGPGLADPPFWVVRDRRELYATTPGGTTMPRGRIIKHPNPRLGPMNLLDWVARLRLYPGRARDEGDPSESERQQLERFRLFSVPTRQYLRRRAWRYFRRLGKMQPGRYVSAISEALGLYEDADVCNGLALIDNWGMIHALFHHSAVLVPRPRGWMVAEGRSLSELGPAPIYEDLWRSAPKSLFDLMAGARCRPVRRWALRMLGRDLVAARAAVGIEEIIGLLGHDDDEVVAFAVEWLRGAGDVSSVTPERWLAIAETARPDALEVLAEIMGRQIAPKRIPIETAARLAAVRPLPLARLALGWLKARGPASDDERRDLLALLEAACEPLRPEILAWLRSALSASPEFHPDWLLEFLDCRHADARAEGMNWFREEPRARDDVGLWQRLMESPYDDVRFGLAAELDARLRRVKGDGAVDPASTLSPERLRLLWASVLLNVNRGHRSKPGVVEQVARRLGRRPDEAEVLLPLLVVGLRSLRAPERRAALAAVVRLVEERPETASMVRKALPELQWA